MNETTIEYAVRCRECGQEYFQSKCPGDLCEDHSPDYVHVPVYDMEVERHRKRMSPENQARSAKNRAYALARRFKIFERDNWTCHLCDKPIDRDAKWPQGQSPVLDHILPKAHGGTDEAENLRAAHAVCNNVRGTIDVDAFRSGWCKPTR